MNPEGIEDILQGVQVGDVKDFDAHILRAVFANVTARAEAAEAERDAALADVAAAEYRGYRLGVAACLAAAETVLASAERRADSATAGSAFLRAYRRGAANTARQIRDSLLLHAGERTPMSDIESKARPRLKVPDVARLRVESDALGDELDAAEAEADRLRARAEAAEAALATARAEGAAAERAAVVAWVRWARTDLSAEDWPAGEQMLDAVAETVERGEHIRPVEGA